MSTYGHETYGLPRSMRGTLRSTVDVSWATSYSDPLLRVRSLIHRSLLMTGEKGRTKRSVSVLPCEWIKGMIVSAPLIGAGTSCGANQGSSTPCRLASHICGVRGPPSVEGLFDQK